MSMNTIILSGEKLVQAQAKTSHELPSAGTKQFEPNHSWLEQKQIQSALDERKALLEVERVDRWSNLMRAEWLPEKHKAEVHLKTKHWEAYGHHNDGKDWLFPEEVLLLLEMNCLECLFDDVPLSIQRGYTVLLKPEGGCSFNEYRVFAHLCRMGYRVVRHIPDLTVTAYERQIRLDQHLEQKKTYSDAPSLEPDLPRPDLPPKKVLDLPENTEITIESSNVFSGPLIKSSEENEKHPEVSVIEKHISQKSVEIIDIADSSEESESESSDDSDIEIIEDTVSAPKPINRPDVKVEGDDDDIEIIELPLVKKEIIVATIESSDSDEEKESSGSESEKSYDGNWKRNQPGKKKSQFIRPPTMSNLKFLSVDEFCTEKGLRRKRNKPTINSTIEEPNPLETSNNNDIDTDSVEDLSLETNSKTRPPFPVTRQRHEILDFMPTMAGTTNKIMTLQSADLRLIPCNIIPKQKSYTYNRNTLKARVFSTFRPGYRGRRNFHGPRFNSYNPYYNSGISFSNQIGIGFPSLQNSSLTQMFGSDIHSVARGMMQFASALLLNSQSNGPGPFNPQSAVTHFSPPNFSSLSRFHERPRNFTSQHYNPFRPRSPIGRCENNYGNFQNRNFDAADRSLSSVSSVIEGEFDSSERTFSPPTERRRHFNGAGHSNRNRRPRSRSNFNRRSTYIQPPVHFGAIDSVLPPIDPAYAKPDVPLAGGQNVPTNGDGEFVPLKPSTQKPVEVINIVDEDDDVVPLKGISSRFVRKRKKKIKQRMMFKKKFKKNLGFNKEMPPIIFLDSPSSSSSAIGSLTVKQKNSDLNIKTESSTDQNSSVKQENENCSEVGVKREINVNGVEEVAEAHAVINEIANRVASEGPSEVCVKVEDNSGENVRPAIKAENLNDNTSVISVSTLLVKTESKVKTEPDCSILEKIKTEPILNPSNVKTEDIVGFLTDESKIVENALSLMNAEEKSTPSEEPSCELDKNGRNISSEDVGILSDVSDRNISTIVQEENNVQMDIDGTDECNISMTTSKVEGDNDNSAIEVDVPAENCDIDLLRTSSNDGRDVEVSSENVDMTDLENSQNTESAPPTISKVSSWAEIKKHNVPLVTVEGSQSEEDSDEDGEEIRPLIKAKHCKTLGTVLSALQIFSPFTPQIPEDIPKLKISFDMYLPTDFRKSQRGLPQYRIVVFGGMDPLPSPAQLYELQTRFEDNVPVLRAVVMPGSVVFYSCANVSLPVDVTSYHN